jgi:hypothetical protein
LPQLLNDDTTTTWENKNYLRSTGGVIAIIYADIENRKRTPLLSLLRDPLVPLVERREREKREERV